MSAARESSGETENFLLSWLNRWKIELFILVLTALSLRSLIHSGYFWDDAVNATLYLAEKFDNLPLWQNLLTFMRNYIELGRINLLSCYYYLLFYIEDVRIYKLIIILSVCANQLLLGMTVRYATRSRRIAQAAMLLIPLLIQFRPYQDPVTGFYALMQVIFAELILTVYFLLRFLREGRRKNFWISLLLFAVSLLTYEVSYPFILMILLVCWAEKRNLRESIRITIPFGILILICLTAIFIVRSLFVQGETYSGIAFSLDIGRILRTWLIQLLAALPLSHFLFNSQIAIMGSSYLARETLPYRSSTLLLQTESVEWLIAFGFVLTFFWITHSKNQNTEKSNQSGLTLLAVLGLCFWLLPAIPIALSARYQGQLLPGLGYLPVYLEYFGVSMLMCALAAALAPRLKVQGCRSKWLLAGGSVLLVWSLVNSQHNRIMIDRLNRSFLYPRQAGELALQNGLIAFLPDSASVVSLNPDPYIWEASWNQQGLFEEYYSIYSRRNFSAEGLSAGFSTPGDLIHKYQNQPLPEDFYVLAYGGNQSAGLAKLGRLTGVDAEKQLLAVDHVLYFVSGKDPEFSSITYQKKDQSSVQLKRRDAWQVRKTPQGILYQLPKEETVYFETLDLFGF